MNEIIKIQNVRARINEAGMAELHIEDVARGLGFTQRQNKNGKVYESIRWERISGYLAEFGFSALVPKDGFIPTSWDGEKDSSPTSGGNGLPEFIPENIFYKLCFKAENEAARKFQDVVTDEVLPSIRKHGAYITPITIDRIIESPEFGIELLTKLKEERDKRRTLEAENDKQAQIIGELKPYRDYVDHILSSMGTMTSGQIAADYGMTANRLNKILHEEHILRKVNGQWILYEKHMGKGYTKSETIQIVRSDGTPDTKLFTKWTQKGRLMINELLNKRGIYADMAFIHTA